MAIGTCRPNVVSISSALAACREGASWPLALDLLRSMHPVHGVLPNVVSLSSVLKACASASRWHEALEVFVEAAARLVPNIVARNAAQSACASEGLWASSLSGFQASLGRDLVSINTAIDACDKARRWEWAVAALQRAAVASLVPDVVTYSTATSACQSGHGWKLAISLVLEISQRHMRPNAASWTAAAGACVSSQSWSTAVQLLRHEHGTVARAVLLQSCEVSCAWALVLPLLAAAQASAVAATTAMAALPWAPALAAFRNLQREQVTAGALLYTALASSSPARWAYLLLQEMRSRALEPNLVVLAAAAAIPSGSADGQDLPANLCIR
ncbi:unnamed protein product [Symbiodinium microadriaticum]|nr:unnamed protein product [Symbiodinium microadriaticum]